MPSKDTIPFALPKSIYKELERIRQAMAKDLGIDENNVTLRQAITTLYKKSQRGKIYVQELRDIMLGKIK